MRGTSDVCTERIDDAAVEVGEGVERCMSGEICTWWRARILSYMGQMTSVSSRNMSKGGEYSCTMSVQRLGASVGLT